ncbi:MAG: hypothetical protein AABO58_05030 [Acidobacteriota bacterium]
MKRLVLPLLFLATALPAAAWTRAAEHRIALKGAELGPPDLRLVIETFHDDYLRGIDLALGDEGSEIHREKLRARIEAESRAIVQMIRTNKPMVQIVERLGILAHLVGDANNPFHLGDDAAMRADFERYFERKMARFPTFFYGVDRRFALGAYLDGTFARTRKFVTPMADEYTRGTSATFDDRSTAFGVASVCYSHAVTDIVNLQYFIWKEAGGNVRNAPQSIVLNGN